MTSEGHVPSSSASSPDLALFKGEIQGLVAICHENERPLLGLAGLLDWRFQGLISRCVRSGVITGKIGECTYVPVSRPEVSNQRTCHVLLLGAGYGAGGGKRGAVPAESLHCLRKNLASLKLEGIGLSVSDFGNLAESSFKKTLKGVSLCLLP